MINQIILYTITFQSRHLYTTICIGSRGKYGAKRMSGFSIRTLSFKPHVFVKLEYTEKKKRKKTQRAHISFTQTNYYTYNLPPLLLFTIRVARLDGKNDEIPPVMYTFFFGIHYISRRTHTKGYRLWLAKKTTKKKKEKKIEHLFNVV